MDGQKETTRVPDIHEVVRQLGQGHVIKAHLCWGKPKALDDLAQQSLGLGWIDRNGGRIKVHTSGTAECVAYVVNGGLVVTRPDALPAHVRRGQEAQVAPLTETG